VSDGRERLAQKYDTRIADTVALAKSGTSIVGIVGSDLPRSLVSAAGAVPLRLFWTGEVSDSARDEAFVLLGRGIDRATQRLLAAVLDGQFDFLSGILVTHDCQASVVLFYILRELDRQGRISVPVHLVDLVHLDREPTLVFDVAQLARAAAVLEGWTGTAVTAESLRGEMLAHALVDAELATLQRRRRARHPVVTGSDALHAYGVASALPPGAALSFLRDVIADLPEVGDRAIGLRLFLSGSTPIGDELYLLIERQEIGGHPVSIVGEDHDWGDLVLTVKPELPRADMALEELYAALVAGMLGADPAAPTAGQKARGVASRAAISATGAAALLSIVREHDDAAAWDFPHQFADAGVPARLLDRQPALPSTESLTEALADLAGVA
jgi:hypothetical protein